MVAIEHRRGPTDVGGARQTKVEIDPKKHAAIPDDMTISPNRTPEWDDDRDLIFFGIHELKPRDDEKNKKKDSDKDDEKV